MGPKGKAANREPGLGHHNSVAQAVADQNMIAVLSNSYLCASLATSESGIRIGIVVLAVM